jgi:hypothetical protein
MWHDQDPFQSLDNIFMVAEVVRSGHRPLWYTRPDGGDGGHESGSGGGGEAPTALRELVDALWSQDASKRPAAGDALALFESGVAPALAPLTTRDMFRRRPSDEPPLE